MLPGHDAIIAGSRHNIPDSVGEWGLRTCRATPGKLCDFSSGAYSNRVRSTPSSVLRCLLRTPKKMDEPNDIAAKAAMTGTLRIGDELFSPLYVVSTTFSIIVTPRKSVNILGPKVPSGNNNPLFWPRVLTNPFLQDIMNYQRNQNHQNKLVKAR